MVIRMKLRVCSIDPAQKVSPNRSLEDVPARGDEVLDGVGHRLGDVEAEAIRCCGCFFRGIFGRSPFGTIIREFRRFSGGWKTKFFSSLHMMFSQPTAEHIFLSFLALLRRWSFWSSVRSWQVPGTTFSKSRSSSTARLGHSIPLGQLPIRNAAIVDDVPLELGEELGSPDAVGRAGALLLLEGAAGGRVPVALDDVVDGGHGEVLVLEGLLDLLAGSTALAHPHDGRLGGCGGHLCQAWLESWLGLWTGLSGLNDAQGILLHCPVAFIPAGHHRSFKQDHSN